MVSTFSSHQGDGLKSQVGGWRQFRIVSLKSVTPVHLAEDRYGMDMNQEVVILQSGRSESSGKSSLLYVCVFATKFTSP